MMRAGEVAYLAEQRVCLEPELHHQARQALERLL
jgi:hypothetical protein